MTGQQTPKTLSVTILEREYMVACPEGAEQALEHTAEYLDKKMKEIRTSGKVYGTERIAVMAALNLTHELLNKNSNSLGDSQVINNMMQKIDQVLKK